VPEKKSKQIMHQIQKGEYMIHIFIETLKNIQVDGEKEMIIETNITGLNL
jgi:hypothetical protein